MHYVFYVFAVRDISSAEVQSHQTPYTYTLCFSYVEEVRYFTLIKSSESSRFASMTAIHEQPLSVSRFSVHSSAEKFYKSLVP